MFLSSWSGLEKFLKSVNLMVKTLFVDCSPVLPRIWFACGSYFGRRCRSLGLGSLCAMVLQSPCSNWFINLQVLSKQLVGGNCSWVRNQISYFGGSSFREINAGWSFWFGLEICERNKNIPLMMALMIRQKGLQSHKRGLGFHWCFKGERCFTQNMLMAISEFLLNSSCACNKNVWVANFWIVQ